MKKVLFIIALLLTSGIAADENKAIRKEVESALMCQCGCNMTVENCNHMECGFSVPERKKIAQMVTAGKNKEEIIKSYVTRFGQQVLSAPPKSDIMAWVTPIVIAFVALGVLLIYLKERPNDVSRTLVKSKEIPFDEMIEKELKEMD